MAAVSPRTRLTAQGFTLIETVTAIGLAGVCMALVIPVLSHPRSEAHINQCANNLRLLGSSAIAHSFDHDGKFFPQVVARDPDRDPDEPVPTTQWFDEDVVGQYLRGEPLQVNTVSAFMKDHDRLNKTIAFGLGKGAFVCPDDAADPARSYDFNIWASSLPASESFVEKCGGTFFDATAAELDRLMLFADVVGTRQTLQGWATDGQFGYLPTTPGTRFGSTALYSDSGFQPVMLRFQDTPSIAGDLDYVRHGENNNRSLPVGAVNIALADGHVRLFTHDELYVAEDMGRGRFTRSTLNVLWSPADARVQENMPQE